MTDDRELMTTLQTTHDFCSWDCRKHARFAQVFQRWGIAGFRPLQQEAFEAVHTGQDLLAVRPDRRPASPRSHARPARCEAALARNEQPPKSRRNRQARAAVAARLGESHLPNLRAGRRMGRLADRRNEKRDAAAMQRLESRLTEHLFGFPRRSRHCPFVRSLIPARLNGSERLCLCKTWPRRAGRPARGPDATGAAPCQCPCSTPGEGRAIRATDSAGVALCRGFGGRR